MLYRDLKFQIILVVISALDLKANMNKSVSGTVKIAKCFIVIRMMILFNFLLTYVHADEFYFRVCLSELHSEF